MSNEGLVENTFTLKILNKSQIDKHYKIELEGLSHFNYIGKNEINIKAGESYSLPLSIAINPYDLKKTVTEFNFVVVDAAVPDVRLSQKSNFFKGR